jgi:hypothetical protein
MKLRSVLVGLCKVPAGRPFAKLALEPVVDLPHRPQPAVNPLVLLGLYRD